MSCIKKYHKYFLVYSECTLLGFSVFDRIFRCLQFDMAIIVALHTVLSSTMTVRHTHTHTQEPVLIFVRVQYVRKYNMCSQPGPLIANVFLMVCCTYQVSSRAALSSL